MADDLDSEIGDATEIQDESLSKELNSTVEVQNDEVFSSHSENIDTQCVLEDKPTQENLENEVVSFPIFVNLIWQLRVFFLFIVTNLYSVTNNTPWKKQ